MVSLESSQPEGQEWNWFAQELTNHLPNYKMSDKDYGCADGKVDKTEIQAGECAPMTAGRWNSFANTFPFANGSLRLAKYDQEGNEAAKPHFPWKLKFRNGPTIKHTDASERFLTSLVEGGSAQIDSGVVLYEVLATDDIETAESEAEWFKLGEIKTTTYFTPSLWGDEHLYFQHGSVNDDMRDLGESLTQQAGYEQMIQDYRFNFEKYGNWNNPRFF